MTIWFDEVDESMVHWEREGVISSAEIDDLIKAYEKEQAEEQEHE